MTVTYQWVLFVQRSCYALFGKRSYLRQIVDLSILGHVSVAMFMCRRNLS